MVRSMHGGIREGWLGSPKQRRALRVVPALVLLLAAACGGENRSGLETAPRLARAERMRAAHAGVDWMVEHWRAMPVGWAWPSLSRLRRVVADPARAERLDTALRAIADGDHHRALPADLSDPAVLAPDRLMPALAELARRRETGEPWAEGAATIARAIGADEAAFWKTIPLRHRPAIVHLLEELDIDATVDLDDVIGALRRIAERSDTEWLGADSRYVYALTHVVLARSRYLRRHPDPAGLAFAPPVLREAVAQRLAAERMDVFGLDLVGEAVAALALLREDDGAVVRAARHRLIALQNGDGSWGEEAAGAVGGVTPRRIHPTFNAIVALIPLPGTLSQSS